MGLSTIIADAAIGGIRIRETRLATEAFEDWSNCRSPARAKRREKYGHKQWVVRGRRPACFMLAGELIIHPTLMRQVENRLAANVDKHMFNALCRPTSGDTHG